MMQLHSLILNIKGLNFPALLLNQLTYITDDIFQLVKSKLSHIPWIHILHHVFPLGWNRAPVWVSWDIQQISVGYLFYIW